MTAPTSPGSYAYTVWGDKGDKSKRSGQVDDLQHHRPGPARARAAITTLTPNHGQTGANVVIAGTNLGTAGTVKFGGTTATTTAWSATSVTAKVPRASPPAASTSP